MVSSLSGCETVGIFGSGVFSAAGLFRALGPVTALGLFARFGVFSASGPVGVAMGPGVSSTDAMFWNSGEVVREFGSLRRSGLFTWLPTASGTVGLFGVVNESGVSPVVLLSYDVTDEVSEKFASPSKRDGSYEEMDPVSELS